MSYLLKVLILTLLATVANATTVIRESKLNEDIEFWTNQGGTSLKEVYIDGDTGTLHAADLILANPLAKTSGGTGITSTATFPASGVITTDAGTSTFTNKTFDANGTGNSITNIEAADIVDGTLMDADINASAAIARSKMANGTADHVVINDAGGAFSSEAQLSRTRGGTGITSTATFPSSGVITTDGGSSTFTNKTFDANGTGNSITNIESADIVDGTLVNADINASAAIAGTKITPTFGAQDITNDNVTISGTTGNATISRASNPPVWIQQRAGTSITSPTSVSSGNDLGRYAFFGYSTAAGGYLEAARISVEVGGTPDQTATDMPGTLWFEVTPDGSATPVEAMRIEADADITMGTATGNALIDSTPTSATTPTYGFIGDTNTGMFRSAADTLAFATGGVVGLTLESDGVVTHTDFNDNGEAIRIYESSGVNVRLRLGTTSADGVVSSGGTVYVLGDSNANSSSEDTFVIAKDSTLPSTATEQWKINSDGNVIHTSSGNVFNRITALGDAYVELLADTNDAGGEDENPYILFSQDGGSTLGIIGLQGTGTTAGDGTTITGASSNELIMGMESATGAGIATSATVRIHSSSAGVVSLWNTATVGSTVPCWSGAAGAIRSIGTCTSSIRFKENVEDISDEDIEKVSELRPVSFDWIEERGGAHDYGLIAEEVEQVFPELVEYDIDGQIGGVKYQHLTALLLKKIQSLEARIEALESH